MLHTDFRPTFAEKKLIFRVTAADAVLGSDFLMIAEEVKCRTSDRAVLYRSEFSFLLFNLRPRKINTLVSCVTRILM